MRKVQLGVLACVTAVLTALWLTMIMWYTRAADHTNTKEVSIISESGVTESTPEYKHIDSVDVKHGDPASELKQTPKPIVSLDNEDESCAELYSPSEFMGLGAIQWNGWLWTYYSERVLPGGGLDIPGRHNDDGGYICDCDDYICLSSSALPYGSVFRTPFGKYGKVYDTGCASHIIDVYVSW